MYLKNRNNEFYQIITPTLKQWVSEKEEATNLTLDEANKIHCYPFNNTKNIKIVS